MMTAQANARVASHREHALKATGLNWQSAPSSLANGQEMKPAHRYPTIIIAGPACNETIHAGPTDRADR
jgi:hypothetical protein